MNLLYLSGHSILEFDELRLFSELGINVFSLGSYLRPGVPMDDKRPALDLPEYPELVALVEALPNLGRENLPDELVEWADVLLFAAFPMEWLAPQWERVRHKRVIWRTIGQSNPQYEMAVKPFFEKGLEIVRYSPAEQRYFEPRGWAGQSALIRFAKNPDEFGEWTGKEAVVGNVSQHDAVPHGRDQFIHWKFWEMATSGLPYKFAGSHSEKIGGKGVLGYEALRQFYRDVRAYVCMGTVPSSYTLNFVEAFMTGVPLVSVGKQWQWAGQDLFEADELALWSYNDPFAARAKLIELLQEPDTEASQKQRERAIALFGKEEIKRQWKQFLL